MVITPVPQLAVTIELPPDRAELHRHQGELGGPDSRALAAGLRAGLAVLSGPAHPSVIAPHVRHRLAANRHGLGTDHGDAVRVLAGRVRLTEIERVAA